MERESRRSPRCPLTLPDHAQARSLFDAARGILQPDAPKPPVKPPKPPETPGLRTMELVYSPSAEALDFLYAALRSKVGRGRGRVL